MPSIVKNPVGQVNRATTHKGKTVVRENKLIFKAGEELGLFDVVYDDIHFLYQNLMPISREEYEFYRNHKTGIPVERQGPLIMCTCGSEGVLVLDSKAPLEWQNKLICKNVVMFGIHQTSMLMSDGKIKLPKKLEQDHLLTDGEVIRTMKE